MKPNRMTRAGLGSFPLWGKAGVGACLVHHPHAVLAPTPTLPQRGREQHRRPFHGLRVVRRAMEPLK